MKRKIILPIIFIFVIALFIAWLFGAEFKTKKQEFYRPTIPESWVSISDTQNGLAYKYPTNITADFISQTDWPPKVQVVPDFVCPLGGVSNQHAGETTQRKISGEDFCITTETQGAAGSTYRQYAYAFSFRSQKTIILTFSLRFPNCANYENGQAIECQAEENSFDLDSLIFMIASSFN